MPFRTRNSYYLRISAKYVLPTYLYLDERHLEWMSDAVLQHVLSDIQPIILPKLKAEAEIRAGSKKGTVDTHRGDNYQFCYFLRKVEPHSVAIKVRKTRAFVAVPKLAQVAPMAPPLIPRQRGKRKETSGKAGTRKKRVRIDAPSEHESNTQATTDTVHADLELRRSQRAKASIPSYVHPVNDEHPEDDVEMTESEPLPADQAPDTTGSPTFELDIEEEEKPKPLLQLKYQGFNIHGHCLCIVVEPWPSIRSGATPFSLSSNTPNVPRTSSILQGASVIPHTSDIRTLRERTPLFLPDDDEWSPPPSVMLGTQPESLFTFDQHENSDSDDGGMMLFSQVLNTGGDLRAGAADDDEDVDGAIFFGDADENREF